MLIFCISFLLCNHMVFFLQRKMHAHGFYIIFIQFVKYNNALTARTVIPNYWPTNWMQTICKTALLFKRTGFFPHDCWAFLPWIFNEFFQKKYITNSLRESRQFTHSVMFIYAFRSIFPHFIGTTIFTSLIIFKNVFRL